MEKMKKRRDNIHTNVYLAWKEKIQFSVFEKFQSSDKIEKHILTLIDSVAFFYSIFSLSRHVRHSKRAYSITIITAIPPY